VVGDVKVHGRDPALVFNSRPLAKALKAECPEVLATARITSANLLVRKGDIKFQERHTLWGGLFLLFRF